MADRKPSLLERAQQSENKGNRDIRGLWERYRAHRERVTAEVLALAPPEGGRLALLGAGNANDYDLEALSARYAEVHLVDLDPAALARATGRQSPGARARLRTHAPVDLSGLYRQLDRGRVPDFAALVSAGTAEVLRQLPGGFDVVASACVVSQMGWALEFLARDLEAPLAELQQALLRVHLRTLLGLISANGAALLASDLVSTNNYPLDELPPGADLRALAERLAAERIAYPVCNPELIRQTIRRDPELAAACALPAMGEPWLWTGPKELVYLVFPFVLRRKA